MLPESQEGQRLYLEQRDMRNRHREMVLRQAQGDMAALMSDSMRWLAYHADMATLREEADFAQDEEMLTPDLAAAIENLIAWGAEVRRLATSLQPTTERGNA